MSLQSLRDALLDAKTSEINGIQRSCEIRLRSLYKYTKLVGGVVALHAAAQHNAPPSPTEYLFLSSNDLASGRLYAEESLPYPTPNASASVLTLNTPDTRKSDRQQDASSSLDQGSDSANNLPSAGPQNQAVARGSVDKNGTVVLDTPPRSPHVAFQEDSSDELRTSAIRDVDDKQANALHHDNSGSLDSPGLDAAETTRTLSIEDRARDVQKAQTAQASEKGRIKDRVDTSAPVVSINDNASSPSSTAGAYSTSTPKPPQQSPDTSPEAEIPPLVPRDFESRADDSTAMSPTVSKRLINHNTSPEAQLRLEEAQAHRPETTVQRDAEQSLSQEGKDDRGEFIAESRLEGGLKQSSLSNSVLMDVRQPDLTRTDASKQDQSRRESGVHLSSKSNAFKKPSLDLTPSRMTTRVSSGAIRQKSVSEILGSSPRKSSHTPAYNTAELRRLGSSAIPRNGMHQKSSTVVFSKDITFTNKSLRDELEGYLGLKGASLDTEKDYLRPLFLHQAWSQPRAQPLGELISKAGKTITTADVQASLREVFEYKILRRIYNMQNSNKWSLRQMAKFQDPESTQCHHDCVLNEMKWMRSDFREERRWKTLMARNMAVACAEYVAAPSEMKQTLVIKTSRPKLVTEVVIPDSFDEASSVPPLSTGTSVQSDDDPLVEAIVSPSAIFSLHSTQAIFQLQHSSTGDALLNELPLYDPKAENHQIESSLPLPSRNRLDPVSKHINGKLVPRIGGLPKKRSRYEYEQSDDEPPPLPRPSHKRTKSTDPSPFLSPARRSSPRAEIPPEEQEVALFNPINKHILDRLHATHAFRPPNEFPMPSVAYFEARPQSQWTWDEDQRLRYAVRKYTYNWSLIAMELQSQCQTSGLVSGAERRTPWECFERWVQLEGLPPEMSKTAYFKAYQARLETATRTIQAQAQLAAQHAAAGGQTPSQTSFNRLRRSSHQPIRVERRRDTRHISMIDAMKKIEKRRENVAQRSVDTAKAAEMRKSSQVEVSGGRAPATIHTPQELSRYKQDREAKARENAEAIRHQQKMQLDRQRALQTGQAQSSGLQQQQSQTAVNGQVQTFRSAAAPSAGPMPQAHISQAGAQVRAANGGGVSGLTAQQIQALQQSRLNPQTNPGDMARLAAIQQQRQMQFQQAQMSQNPGLAAAHLSPNAIQQQQQQQLQQQQMLAAFQRANNLGVNGVANGISNISNGSSLTGQLTNQQQAAYVQLQQHIHQQHPHLPQEQVRALAQERLKSQMRTAMSQTALAAASGSAAAGLPNQSLANQHLGLHGHSNAQMMAAFAAAQNSLGTGSPGNSAAAMAAQGVVTANSLPPSKNLTGPGLVNSPTQMYRNMNIHAAQQARLSGSPGMIPAQLNSRAGTPSGMVRTPSGTSASPTIGSGPGR